MRYKCGICIEQLKVPILIRECGHLFCEGCLSQWAKVRKNAGLSCPFCRTDYTSRGLIRVKIHAVEHLQNKELCTKKNNLQEELIVRKQTLVLKAANYDNLLKELDSSVKKAEAQLRLNEDLERRLQQEYESKEINIKNKEMELTVCRNFFRKVSEKRFKERPEDQTQVQSAFNMAIDRINRCRDLIHEKRKLSDQLTKGKALLQDLKSFLEGLGRLRLEESLSFTSFQSACELMGWPAPIKKPIQPSTSAVTAMEPPKVPNVVPKIPEKMKIHQRLNLISKKLYSGLVEVPTPKPKPNNAFEKMRMMQEDEKLLHLPREDENNRPPDRFPKFIMADRNGEVLKPLEPKTVGPIDLRYPTKEELKLKRMQRQEALRREAEDAEAAKNKDNSLFQKLDDINTDSKDETTLNLTADASMINSPLQVRDNKFNVRSFSEAKRRSLSKICGMKPKHNATINLDSEQEEINYHGEDKIEEKSEKKEENFGRGDSSGKNRSNASPKDKADKPPKAPSSHLATASTKNSLDLSRNSKIELYQRSQLKSIPKTGSQPTANNVIVLQGQTQNVKTVASSGTTSGAGKEKIPRPETSTKEMPKVTSISLLLENKRKRRSDDRDDAATKRPKAAAVNRNARSTGSVQKISTFLKKPDMNNSVIILD